MAPQASKQCGLHPRLSAYRLLREQRHQFGTGAWHLPRTQDFNPRSISIKTKRDKCSRHLLYFMTILLISAN